MSMYLLGNTMLHQEEAWNDPTLAITLVASGWIFVVFHDIPEVHCTLLPPLQENPPNYFDTAHSRMRQTAFDDMHLPRTYMENKAFSMDEQSSARRSARFSNGSLGKKHSGSIGKKRSGSLGRKTSSGSSSVGKKHPGGEGGGGGGGSGGSVGKKHGAGLGHRPSAPFRSNVYQPTEMAVVLNGGTVSTHLGWAGCGEQLG